MRIAHVTFSFWPIRGGADTYLAELYRALDAAGHEQAIYQALTPLRPGEESGEAADAPPSGSGKPSCPYPVVEWPVPLHRSPGRRFWHLTLEVARHRDELFRYDRVIAHYPNYALPLLSHPGLIGLSHGVTWDCDNVPGSRSPARSGGERIGGSRAGSGSRRIVLRSPSSRIKRTLAEMAFRGSRGYVANDTFFLREMGLRIAPGTRPWTEVAPGRWYLPNAVDTERFAPDPDQPPEPVILLARNFYRNRGIHLGIEAFARMAADWPDYRLRIAGGEGDAGYRQECEALARSLGIADRVEFAGPVPWQEMAGAYRRAAVSWVPSLCGEGTSLSALESMACGTPVVASHAGGLPDLPCSHAALSPDMWARVTGDLLHRREEESRCQRQRVQNDYNLSRWSEAWRRVVER
ncbi:MAG: glycosyltransferase family 4 protein [Armatimonadetes bacterium]|nr:glycosyltransferase family 4 protein [Armatimonadota bacterium]